jgi:hypothetical protein
MSLQPPERPAMDDTGGLPGRIRPTLERTERPREMRELDPRPEIEVRGRGPVQAFPLVGRKREEVPRRPCANRQVERFVAWETRLSPRRQDESS